MKKYLSFLLVISLARGNLTVSSSDEDNDAQSRTQGRNGNPRPLSANRHRNHNAALGEGPSGVQRRPSQNSAPTQGRQMAGARPLTPPCMCRLNEEEVNPSFSVDYLDRLKQCGCLSKSGRSTQLNYEIIDVNTPPASPERKQEPEIRQEKQPEVDADFRNEGRPWQQCGRRQGRCPALCGRLGFCCLQGERGRGCRGIDGGENRHRCTRIPIQAREAQSLDYKYIPSERLSLININL